MGRLLPARFAGPTAAAERRRLSRLAIFQAELSDEALAYAEIDAAMVGRWLDLSLLQREAGSAAPQLPPQMAALLEMLPARRTGQVERRRRPATAYTRWWPTTCWGKRRAADRRDLHRWAAAFYGQPFVQMARDHAARTNQNWTDEEIEEFARRPTGVVGQLVAQTNDMGQARGAMARALDWQRHLFAAGEVDGGGGDCDGRLRHPGPLGRARPRQRAAAPQHCLAGRDEHKSKAVAQGNLATMLKDEGKLDEALATYQDVYETFAALDAKQQMAAVLGKCASLLIRTWGKLMKRLKNKKQLDNRQEIKA